MTLRDVDELVRRWKIMRVDTVTRNQLFMRSNFEREEPEHASNFNEYVQGDDKQQDTGDVRQQDKETMGHMRSGQLYPPETEANKSLIKEISIN